MPPQEKRRRRRRRFDARSDGVGLTFAGLAIAKNTLFKCSFSYLEKSEFMTGQVLAW
jgi:hypothetical protein